MRKAEASAKKAKPDDPGLESILEQLWRLRRTLPLETYFKFIDDFAENARRTLARIPDARTRADLREYYRQVIEMAVDLGADRSA